MPNFSFTKLLLLLFFGTIIVTTTDCVLGIDLPWWKYIAFSFVHVLWGIIITWTLWFYFWAKEMKDAIDYRIQSTKRFQHQEYN